MRFESTLGHFGWDAGYIGTQPSIIEDARARSRQSLSAFYGQRLLLVIGLLLAVAPAIGLDSSIKLLTLVALGVCLLGLRKPELGLFGVGILCTLEPIARNLILHGGLWRWNTLNYWLVLVIVLFSPGLARLRSLQTEWFAAFIILLLFELLVTPDLGSGLQQVLDCLVLMGLFVCFMRAVKDDAAWYWLGVLSGVLSAVGSAVFYTQMNRLLPVNENSLAYFPLTGIFAICLAFQSAARRRQQLILVALAAINFVWVFLSGSRGGLLTAAVCFAVLLLGFRSIASRVTLLLGSALVAATVSAQFPALQTRMVEKVLVLFDTNQSLERRTSGRSDLVAGAWQMFRANPMGVGTGGFGATWATLNSIEGQRDFYHSGEEAPAHAGWMKILAENGFPGFLVLAGFVLSFTLSGWRHRSSGMLLLGVLVTSAMSIGYISTELYQKGLWFLAAGAMARLHDTATRARDARIFPPTRDRSRTGRNGLLRFSADNLRAAQ